MKNTVKIKGKKVYLNDSAVGHVGFVRGRWGNGQVEPAGHFIFNLNGVKYRFDTSCFSYSKDANGFIRTNLQEKGVDFLKELTAQSKVL